MFVFKFKSIWLFIKAPDRNNLAWGERLHQPSEIDSLANVKFKYGMYKNWNFKMRKVLILWILLRYYFIILLQIKYVLIKNA